MAPTAYFYRHWCKLCLRSFFSVPAEQRTMLYIHMIHLWTVTPIAIVRDVKLENFPWKRNKLKCRLYLVSAPFVKVIPASD